MKEEKYKSDEPNQRSKNSTDSPINTVTVGIGQADTIQKYGEAASQILQSYSGVRFDADGNGLLHQGRSLKEIHTYKVNADPVQGANNIKQQAGFCAELLEEADYNHDAILQGNTTRRRTTDGIGQTNDPRYDLCSVDKSGSISDPSQMKFLGVDQKGRYSVIEKLAKDESWDRYDCPIDIPKDQYEKALAYANSEADRHLKNAESLRLRGNLEKASSEERLAQKYKQAGERIRPSSVTEAEALLARTNPKKYVARSIMKDVHRAGKNAAEGAVLVSGSVSLVQNICAVNSGEISPQEAAENIVTTTAKAGVTAYGVGSAGSALKAMMHSSKHQAVRQVGTTNFPAMVVMSALEISSVVKEYISGNMTATEALSRLGKSGTGSLAASYGAAVGTVFLGPGVGTMVGSMVGYMVSSSIYDTCLQVLTDADLAYESYERTKELCAAAIDVMQQQRRAFESRFKELLKTREEAMDAAIPAMMDTLDSADTENFTDALQHLAAAFNQQLQFQSFDEFDSFMSDENTTFIF